MSVPCSSQNCTCFCFSLCWKYEQVSEIPHFKLLFHPTWHPRVSAWDLSLATPTCTSKEGLEWATPESQEVRFQCTVVLRDETLTVEGLEGDSRFEAPSQGSPQEFLPLSKHSVGLSELPSFILFQVLNHPFN